MNSTARSQRSRADIISAAWDEFRERKRDEVRAEIIRRTRLATLCHNDPSARAACLEMCKRDPVVFFNDWLWGYDPRNVGTGMPTKVPFVLRPQQERFVRWLNEKETAQEPGLVEKSRDEGVSYLVLGFFLHHWLFVKGFAGGVGSRKEGLVDKLGDPSTLFWKFRDLLYGLPHWMMPPGFDRRQHDNFMRITNPENGAVFIGEAGNNIGRGGRTSMYAVDEAAYLERADLVEAALSENTNVRIDISTPNGIGNTFYDKRHSGKVDVFTFHWRENPDKAWSVDVSGELVYPWYESRVSKLDELIVAQEIDIDYAASAEGVVIKGAWVQAAIGLDLKEGSVSRAGLDVSEKGKDKTMYASRRGGKLIRIQELRGTATEKGRRAIELATEDGVERLAYDRLGVGAGITATVKEREEELPFAVFGIANSENPTGNEFEDQPSTPNNERFANAAAENWWALRLRFRRTYERVVEGIDHPDEDCISIPNDPVLIAQLSQPTYKRNSKDKIVVDKLGNGSGSPDVAESVLYAFWFGEPTVDLMFI